MSGKTGYVYILASKTGTLYVGVTANLFERVFQHKEKLIEGFTSRYGIDRLVYYEETDDMILAISREKQIKKWRREKKIALIQSLNPKWEDLARDWY